VSKRTRKLYDFELEPEVRDWLDSLSDSDFKRPDEVCGMLAEKGAELGGPWSDHLGGPVWEPDELTNTCTKADTSHSRINHA
jgi:hypothetical protein